MHSLCSGYLGVGLDGLDLGLSGVSLDRDEGVRSLVVKGHRRRCETDGKR
jgi:hypothetical protein